MDSRAPELTPSSSFDSLCSAVFPSIKLALSRISVIVTITVLLGTLFPKPVNSWAPRSASTVGFDNNSASRADLGHLNSPEVMEFIQRFQTYKMASQLATTLPRPGVCAFLDDFQPGTWRAKLQSAETPKVLSRWDHLTPWRWDSFPSMQANC